MSEGNEKIEKDSSISENNFLTASYEDKNHPKAYYFSVIKLRKILKRLAFTVCFFTVSLWFTDNYLKYELIENKYKIAVSLEKESARPIMRNVVQEIQKRIKNNEYSFQDLQYMEFLASIEEGDEVLRLYEHLYTLNNQNSQFLIRLGCREYLSGYYEKAKKYFEEASNLVHSNSLPTYLISSAELKLSPDLYFEKIIANIIRENHTNNLLIFPEPFWHTSLPTCSYAHYLRKKEIYEKVSSPFYELCYGITNYLMNIGKENTPYPSSKVKTVLEELYLMGEKIAKRTVLGDSYLSSIPLHLSLTIQRHAIYYYENIKGKIGIQSDLLESKKNKIDELSKNIDLLSSLNYEREKVFEKSKNNLFFLLLTITFTIFALLFIYFIVKILNLYISKVKYTAIMPQNIILSLLLTTIWGFLIISALFLLSPNNLISFLSNTDYTSLLKGSLLSNITISILVSILLLILEKQSQKFKGETSNKNLIHSFTIYFESVVFYQLCILIIGISIWVLGFRLLYSFYPYQLNLIPDLLKEKELYLVQSIIKQY